MSVQDNHKVRVSLTKKSGEILYFWCSREIAETLRSPDTDPETKALIWRSFMSSSDCPSGPEASTPGTCSDVCTSGSVTSGNESCKSASVVRISGSTASDSVSPDPDPTTNSTASSSDSRNSRWTPAAEKLLLAKYKEMEESSIVRKNKWKKIAEDMTCFKYQFTAEQCRLKLKSLKEKYERVKKKNNKSGESPASEDEELEVFDKMPDMQPVCLMDSGLEQKRKRSTLPSPPDGDSKTSTEEKKIKETKRPRRSVDVMKDFFGEALAKKGGAAERRHKEKLETINSLVEVLKGF